MAQTKKRQTKSSGKAPAYGVSFRKNGRKNEDGTIYREPFVDLGAAWQNDDGSISFPMMGGWVTIRAFKKQTAKGAV